MHRITISYAAPADPEGFDAEYRDVHVPLVRKIPGLRRFTLSRPRALGAGEAPYLVAELWFDDAEALEAALQSRQSVDTSVHAEQMVKGHGVPGLTVFTGEVEDALS